jgi:hypothetical protein
MMLALQAALIVLGVAVIVFADPLVGVVLIALGVFADWAWS